MVPAAHAAGHATAEVPWRMTDLSVLRDGDVSTFDFRRPNLLSREDVRAIENAHEVFARRLVTRWGSKLRALVQAEPLGVDQARYDDYVRSMPTPSALGTLSLPPLPGVALVEVNSQLALRLVDRMLGGAGAGLGTRADLTRRPSDVEDALVQDLVGQVGAALSEALGPLAQGAEVLGVDYNPQQVQAVASSDMVVVLTYRVSITQGIDCEGLLSVCYPATLLRPVLEHLQDHARGKPVGDGLDAATARRALSERLDEVPVDLSVSLADCDVSAGDLARLQTGDVLRLDHPVGCPMVGRVGDAAVLEGHVGRRGRRVAFQVSRWSGPPRTLGSLVAASSAAHDDDRASTDRSDG